jgi:hypothetical protein
MSVARRRQIVLGIAGMVLSAFVLGVIAGSVLQRAGVLP